MAFLGVSSAGRTEKCVSLDIVSNEHAVNNPPASVSPGNLNLQKRKLPPETWQKKKPARKNNWNARFGCVGCGSPNGDVTRERKARKERKEVFPFGPLPAVEEEVRIHANTRRQTK